MQAPSPAASLAREEIGTEDGLGGVILADLRRGSGSWAAMGLGKRWAAAFFLGSKSRGAGRPESPPNARWQQTTAAHVRWVEAT